MASITKRGDTYRIRVYCGTDINGTQIMPSMTWTPEPGMSEKQIEKELQRQAVLFEEQCIEGLYFDQSTTFAVFSKWWMDNHAAKQLKPKTVARYRTLLVRTNQAIGHLKLGKIQPKHLLGFYDNLEEDGIRDDIKYVQTADLWPLLKEKELTKKELAEKAGLSINTIHAAFSEKNVAQKSAEAICHVLEVPLLEVFKANSKTVLDPQTILHYHRFISSVLSTAVYQQFIKDNPCQRIKAPRVPQKEARYLDENEASRLISLLEKEDMQYRTIVLLILYTGLRRAEMCGLEWKDIDFQNSLISIRRNSMYLPEMGIYEDEPKTKSSSRVMKVPASAMALLKSYKAWQAEYRLKLGDKWVPSDRLFTQWDGKPIFPDTVSAWFYHFIQKSDLPKISLHSLRHTNATLQIAAGVPIRTVSGRLGHAKTSTTVNIYAHAIQSADEAAAEALDDILSPVKKA